VFALCYHVHGGSGLNFRPADVYEMELNDVEWYVRRLTEQRDREGEALDKASRRGR